jgi:hypothetical protein
LGDVTFAFKVHPTFWEFVLSDCERALKAVRGDVKARTLLRLAFKSFELDIPFSSKDISGKEIDPHSELLYKSHVDKIEKMKAWKDSPFREMRVEKKSTPFALKPLSTKTNCSYCNTGHANKQCKKSLCKKCCLADSLVKKCTAHGKKPPAAAAAAAAPVVPLIV